MPQGIQFKTAPLTKERAVEIAPAAASIVVGGGITARQINVGLKRKQAIDDAIADAAAKAKLADPKLDPKTGAKLPLTSPVRAQQTADFVQALKKPLIKQEGAAAVRREAARLGKPSKFARAKTAFQNARASMGAGPPAPPSTPATFESAAKNIKPAYKGIRTSMTDATTMRQVRNAVGDMMDLGKRGPSILNKELHPALTPIVDKMKAGGRFGGKVLGYGALPISLGVNWLAKKEAENFANAQAGKTPTGQSLAPTQAQAKAAEVKAQKAAPKPGHTVQQYNELAGIFEKIATEVEAQDYGDAARQQLWKRLRPELEKNPAYLSAFENDPGFAAVRKELGYKK